MPNYRETSINASQWQRAGRVVIENPRRGTASMAFVEERVTVINENEPDIIQPVGVRLSLAFQSGAMIQKWDPLTDQKIEGEFYPHDLLRAILYSAYMDCAEKKDIADSQPPDQQGE